MPVTQSVVAQSRLGECKVVSASILVFWTFVAVAILLSTVLGSDRLIVSDPVAMVTAAALVLLVLYVMFAEIKHLYSDAYKGNKRVIWLVIIFAGHILGATAYHLTVVLRSR